MLSVNIWKKRLDIIKVLSKGVSNDDISKIANLKRDLVKELDITMENLKKKVFSEYKEYLFNLLLEKGDYEKVFKNFKGLDYLTSNEVVSMLRKIYNVANEFFPSQEQEEYREKYSYSTLFSELTKFLYNSSIPKEIIYYINAPDEQNLRQLSGLLERNLLNIAKSLFCG